MQDPTRTKPDDKGGMTVAAAGKLGGDKRKATIEPGGYQEMGRRGGATTAQRHGAAHYSRIGKEGGATRRDRGCNYVELGRKGGATVRRLVEAGRRVDAEEAKARDA